LFRRGAALAGVELEVIAAEPFSANFAKKRLTSAKARQATDVAAARCCVVQSPVQMPSNPLAPGSVKEGSFPNVFALCGRRRFANVIVHPAGKIRVGPVPE
jgi:hypothetical protein